MPQAADWIFLKKVDPDNLGDDEEKICDMLLKIYPNDLKENEPKKAIQLFRISQSLLKLKLEEATCAYEIVEKAGAEQAKIESQLKEKISELKTDLEIAQRSVGGRDMRFLRDEIRQMESQLEQKDKELVQLEKDMNKEQKVNEELSQRAEEAEDENRRIKRENEQLQQDVEFYRKELEQKDSHQSRDERSEAQKKLNKANQQADQYWENWQCTEGENLHLKSELENLQKNLEESVREMEKMTDEYNKMKMAVQQADGFMDQLRRERDQAMLQVRELTQQIQARAEEADPVMAAVNAKVEEWRSVLSRKDAEILEYQHMIRNLREKLRAAQMDSDKSNIIALQQAVQERDQQIKLLSDRVEQYTGEMEKNASLIEELKKPLKKEKGPGSNLQQRKRDEINAKLQAAEQRAEQAERSAHIAESDARHKDQELSETLSHIRLYESGTDGLAAAVAEIKESKNQVRMRDRDIETKTREINQLELKINELLDENEELRGRLGLNMKEELDLTEFRRSKVLKERQYRAENQVLLQEIEQLEEERLDLKQRIRLLVKEKGTTGVSISVLNDETIRERSTFKLPDEDEVKQKIDFLQRELMNREKELELKKEESSQFKAKMNEMQKENKQLEQGMKEILKAIQEAQSKFPTETAITLPNLERLISVMEMKHSEGKVDVITHLRAQLDQLTGRNDELRQEMKAAREEAANTLFQLMKANDKVALCTSEVEAVRQSAGMTITLKPLVLPEEMTPSSLQVISSLNEYLIQLLQELKIKEESSKQHSLALEEYKRNFAIMRHQEGLLYKQYISEKDAWKKEKDCFLDLTSKMEEQKELDSVKIQEYTFWLETLQQDPAETKRQVAEVARKMTLLRVNERSLTRRYTTLMEQVQNLRKENNKLKDDSIQMEAVVTERIGYLKRFKEMAAYKMAALQKMLDSSVPSSELERANKQYNDLTMKYRDLLQKDNHLIRRTTALEHLESENISLQEHISSINKELEITKEKLHTLEHAWEHINITGGESNMDNAAKALATSEIVAVSKRITTLEMQELNERQRAEHAQKMYEHMRKSLKQVEERNFELEAKFAEVAKQNLEAQRIERELQDELAESVSKEVSDADRHRICELEKAEAQLRIEVSKLREVSDIAKMQVFALEARQQSREKEVECLRRQVFDYQAQSDEKALIAKLHQQIMALQLSETAAVSRLEAYTIRLHQLQAQRLRVEQQLDAGQQALWQARQEGRQRTRHLRQALHTLRRRFSGALPLSQQEKFSSTMLQLQEDRARAQDEAFRAQKECSTAEGRAQELELRLKGLEELTATLKDVKGAQKVIEWHNKLEEARLQELRKNRELVAQREEIRYLKNMVAEQERSISSLEEELVQQNNLLEEQQLSWDQREVELERQLDMHEKQQSQIIGATHKFEEATGSVPDLNQPLAHQLDQALSKIKEHVRTILEAQATSKTLEEKLKETELALWQAEQNVLSRDRVINELRLRLPATAEREKLLADVSKQDDTSSQRSLKIAHQTISNLQGLLTQKEEVLKKYQNLLARARQEQEETIKKHEEEVRNLHQQLDIHTDLSLDHFRQKILDLMKKPTLDIPTSKQMERLAEMEQMIAEQDTSFSSLMHKLKLLSIELERQKHINATHAKEHATQTARLEERHAFQIKAMLKESEELRSKLSQMETEMQRLNTELEAQKEANIRSPSNTMKNLVERLKAQLAQKEKQLKALSKAMLEFRAQMTSQAEQQIIANAAQKEEALNVQQIVDKQTKELKAHVKELNDELQSWKENVKAGKTRESSMKDEMKSLKHELQRSQKIQNKLQSDRDILEEQLDELKQKVKRLSSGLQGQTEGEFQGSSVEVLQKRIRRLEMELNKKNACEAADKTTAMKDDKANKEELVRWEEGKKWQARMDKVRNLLKDKEKETESLSKQLATLKELYGRLEQEKLSLQRKLKNRGVTADQVVGTRATLEADKEIKELKKINYELEQHIKIIKQQQALPRDAAVEDMNLRNRYLEERLHCLESQLAKEPLSQPSTSGWGSAETQMQKEREVQKEILKLSSENLDLRFQVEQANKDLPRLKAQVSDLKEICDALKKEKEEVEKKLGNIRGTAQSGQSGKCVPELEKTIALMKKVVERVQRENETLKKSSGVEIQERLTTLQYEHEKLKAEYDRMRDRNKLTSKLDAKAKGLEKIVMENERLRRDIKKESVAAEKLRVEKSSLEIKNEELKMELEETTQKLLLAQSKGPAIDTADSKARKATVVVRLFESKMKELENELSKKNTSVSELKLQLTESREKERTIRQTIAQLKEQVELLKNIPSDEIAKEFQSVRLVNHQLEKEKLHLLEQIQKYEEQIGTHMDGLEYKELQAQIQSLSAENSQLQDEVRRMTNELANFDPMFFEELEDLKFNYNVEVKKNILLEEQLKDLAERFGAEVDFPTDTSL